MLANIEWVLIGLSAIIFIALLIFIQINIKLSRMLKKYHELMRGVEGKNLENVLFDHVKRVDEAMAKVDDVQDRCRRMADVQEYCIQRVGMIRFNAFEDTGSDLSFSIALLDAKDNGIIVSSLFGRDESRTYGKPVQNGKSSYLLTNEEQEALQIARRKK
jgi:hypothetical protein